MTQFSIAQDLNPSGPLRADLGDMGEVYVVTSYGRRHRRKGTSLESGSLGLDAGSDPH